MSMNSHHKYLVYSLEGQYQTPVLPYLIQEKYSWLILSDTERKAGTAVLTC